MVGLSVVLEAQKGGHTNKNSSNPQVLNKATMSSSSMAIHTNQPSSSQRCFPATTFLDRCFLCKAKLVPGKDIYMYKGDEAFCSVECRFKQIFSDEAEETMRKDNCAAAKPNSSSTSSSSTSSSSSSRHWKGTKNPGAGGFAY